MMGMFDGVPDANCVTAPNGDCVSEQECMHTLPAPVAKKPRKKRVTAAVTKPSNPKDSVGIKKTPVSCVPAPVIAELGVAMLEGALKYGRHNYRVIGVRASVYYDAVMSRHMPLWWEGEDIDPDSGLSHITKAIASLTVLRDAMIRGTWVDDRPPKTKSGWMTGLDKKVVELLERYPEPKQAFTETKLP